MNNNCNLTELINKFIAYLYKKKKNKEANNFR